MKKLLLVAAVLLLAPACANSAEPQAASTPTPRPTNPLSSAPVSPSPVSAAGAVSVTGAANVTFMYLSPPPCTVLGQNSVPAPLTQAIEIYFSLTAGSASLQLVMRNYHGGGDYAVDSYGNGNYVSYDPDSNAGDSWSSASGTIHIARSDSSLVEGTVDAIVQGQTVTASGSRTAAAHVTGNWACVPH